MMFKALEGGLLSIGVYGCEQVIPVEKIVRVEIEHDANDDFKFIIYLDSREHKMISLLQPHTYREELIAALNEARKLAGIIK